MTRAERVIVAVVAFILALAMGLGFYGVFDAEAHEEPTPAPVQATTVAPVIVPAGDVQIVAPLEVGGERPIICGRGETLNAAGDGCDPIPQPRPRVRVRTTPRPDRIQYFEDGSWINHTRGTRGCTSGALCDSRPVIQTFEDGSWINHTNGTSGCIRGALCDD